jgi:DNA-binding response OmpR family regulator
VNLKNPAVDENRPVGAPHPGAVVLSMDMPDSRSAERRGGNPSARGAETFSVGTPRVLVVEDSETIREMVSEALADAGYLAEAQPDGSGLEEVLDGFRPDLVVLDVMLPGRDGFALMDVILRWGEVGVVLLTARDGLPDRLRGLDSGADDYVVKPFELAELVSRVGAVLRRRGRLPAAVQFGDLMVDVDAGVASRSGTPLGLTATELRVLVYLVEQRGRIVSSAQILNAVWGYEAYDPNLVQVHISGLRQKLETHGPRILHTVRGIGYRLQLSAS